MSTVLGAGHAAVIEEQNIALFQRLLLEETNETKQQVLRSLLLNSQRKLAMIEAASRGAYSTASPAKERLFSRPRPNVMRQIQQEFETATTPLLLIDLRPGLHIVDANPCYVSATMIDAGKVAGERMFDVFPDNPDDPLANGVANLFASIRIVAERGQPHAMPIQRYDVRDAYGNFVERYWQPLNSPRVQRDGKSRLHSSQRDRCDRAATLQDRRLTRSGLSGRSGTRDNWTIVSSGSWPCNGNARVWSAWLLHLLLYRMNPTA